MLIIPTLETERLVLRAPGAGDFALYRDFYADPAASAFYGGPLSAAQARSRLAQDIGHWALRGHGMWTVVEQASRSPIGGCGIVQPEGWPRHELSWWILPKARRRGYAAEASRAVIRWALTDLGWQVVENAYEGRERRGEASGAQAWRGGPWAGHVSGRCRSGRVCVHGAALQA